MICCSLIICICLTMTIQNVFKERFSMYCNHLLLRNSLVLETISNLFNIRAYQRLKGALGRIALLGSYRIYLARRSSEWNGGELITVS